MNRYFYHSIILTKEDARSFYEMLKNVECPMPVIHCPFCSNLSACYEFSNIINALEKIS